MKSVHSSQDCRDHLWDRRLEIHGGVECVVRECCRCGRRELCWSRRPLPVGVFGAAKDRKMVSTKFNVSEASA